MVSAVKCMLAVAIVASVSCSAYAIRCYYCDSLTNTKCGEKFESDDSVEIDCSQVAPARWLPYSQHVANATGCKKVTVRSVGSHFRGKPLIQRTCYFGDLDQTGCGLHPLLYGQNITCDVCSDNLCNGSL